jgi:hypothetical protein
VIQGLRKSIRSGKLFLGAVEHAEKELPMRRWYMPLTLLGLGSIGAVLLSERGRSVLRSFFENLDQASGKFLEWNDGLQDELDRIQATLDRIAESIGPHPGIGNPVSQASTQAR